MGIWNPRAFCPNCGAKIHTHDSSLIPGTRRTGTQCPNCGVKLSGRVGWLDNKAVLEGQQSTGQQAVALVGKGIERRSQRKTTEWERLSTDIREEAGDSTGVIVQPTKKVGRLYVALTSEAGLSAEE